jgi:hypothetical protein
VKTFDAGISGKRFSKSLLYKEVFEKQFLKVLSRKKLCRHCNPDVA